MEQDMKITHRKLGITNTPPRNAGKEQSQQQCSSRGVGCEQQGWNPPSQGSNPPSQGSSQLCPSGKPREGCRSSQEGAELGQGGSVSAAQPGLFRGCSKRNKPSLCRAGKEITAIKCSKEDLEESLKKKNPYCASPGRVHNENVESPSPNVIHSRLKYCWVCLNSSSGSLPGLLLHLILLSMASESASQPEKKYRAETTA